MSGLANAERPTPSHPRAPGDRRWGRGGKPNFFSLFCWLACCMCMLVEKDAPCRRSAVCLLTCCRSANFRNVRPNDCCNCARNMERRKKQKITVVDAHMMSRSVHPWGQHLHDGHRLRCKSRERWKVSREKGAGHEIRDPASSRMWGPPKAELVTQGAPLTVQPTLDALRHVSWLTSRRGALEAKEITPRMMLGNRVPGKRPVVWIEFALLRFRANDTYWSGGLPNRDSRT